MGGKRIRTVFGQLGLTQVRYVSPVRMSAATGLVADVYAQSERDFGLLAPPVALHSPAPDVLAAAWLMLRETLLVTGHVERGAKETVATEVSASNECLFCVTIHSGTLTGLVRSDSSGDQRFRAVGAWTRAGTTEDTATRYQPACSAAEAPELIGTAVLLQYLNRMVNVFLGEVPLPPGVPKVALGTVMRVLGGMIQTAAGHQHEPGAALDLLPTASVTPDLSWSAANPAIAGAYARACAAIDLAGTRSVPDPVRALVSRELATWHGEARGLSRAWVEEAASGLPLPHRPAGRLALLIALASYQIDGSVIDEFRLDQPGDETLIELAAWASLAAARRVGSWIPVSDQATNRLTADETA